MSCQRAIGINISRMCRVPTESTIVSVAALPGDFPGALSISWWSHWRSQHCINPQCDYIAHLPATNIVVDWWDDGKLDAIPFYAIMKSQSCLGIARDQANIFFAWTIGTEAEGVPLPTLSSRREVHQVPRTVVFLYLACKLP